MTFPSDRPCATNVHRLSEFAAASVSYFANLLLLALIVARTPHELKVYSRILLLNCIVDMVFTTASFVLEVHVPVHSGNFMAVLNGFIRSSTAETTFWLANAYFFTMYLSVIAVTVPFVYRYCVVCRNYVMGNRSFYALVLFTVVFTSLLPLSCRLCYYPDMQRILATRTQSEVYGTLPCKFSAQIPLFSMELSWSTVIPLLMGTCMVTYNYGVVSVCSWKIYRHLRSKAHAMTERTQSLHAQMNYMLLAQAITPLALIVAPLITTFTVVWQGVTESESMMWVTSVLSWIPVANPVFAIYFVKAYRTALMWVVGIRRRGVKGPSTAPSQKDENARTNCGGLSEPSHAENP